MNQKNIDNLGVIIGRFQAPNLHEGHIHLFNEVLKESNNVLVLITSSRGQKDFQNPLSFNLRKEMIKSKFPKVAIDNLFDYSSNKHWSKITDKLIDNFLAKNNLKESKVTLYGSRDSFFPFYHGKYKTNTKNIKI